jgi:hypothetical protein
MLSRAIRTALFCLAIGGVIGYGQQEHPPAAVQVKDKNKPAGEEGKKQDPPQQLEPGAAAGAMIFIDPATGQIREPDANEMGALLRAAPAAAARAAAPTPPVFIQGPGNAVGLKLGAESQSYMVATKGPDGKITLECVTGDKAASTRVNSGDPPAKEKPSPSQPSH